MSARYVHVYVSGEKEERTLVSLSKTHKRFHVDRLRITTRSNSISHPTANFTSTFSSSLFPPKHFLSLLCLYSQPCNQPALQCEGNHIITTAMNLLTRNFHHRLSPRLSPKKVEWLVRSSWASDLPPSLISESSRFNATEDMKTFSVFKITYLSVLLFISSRLIALHLSLWWA